MSLMRVTVPLLHVELSRVYQPVDLLQLDLHRLSKPAAQSELLWHVNLLASALDSGSLGLVRLLVAAVHVLCFA